MISTRNGTFAAGWPLLSRASTVTSVCDDPSSDSTSGLAVIASDRLISDGPASGGGWLSASVQLRRERGGQQHEHVCDVFGHDLCSISMISCPHGYSGSA